MNFESSQIIMILFNSNLLNKIASKYEQMMYITVLVNYNDVTIIGEYFNSMLNNTKMLTF